VLLQSGQVPAEFRARMYLGAVLIFSETVSAMAVMPL
jgi:hypothetical protein